MNSGIVWEEQGKRVWQSENCFVISENGCWLPGCYDSVETAKIAFGFGDDVLQSLQDSVNPGGVITAEMLAEFGKI